MRPASKLKAAHANYGNPSPHPETLPSHSIIKDLKLCSTTPSFMSANNAIFSETSEVPESFKPLVDPNF